MKVGDLVKRRDDHVHQGVVVEAGSHPDANNGPACRIKWFDGADSFEWVKFLEVISESR